ncbi:MAG: transporter [Sphingobium sp.]|jgi:outer membrane protein TolC|uniref:TolC family protein n=1 Tax=Sphingobium soli TaxID=1591116 RepID=UPI000C58E58D|nr:transporter [Sphingobium sp.]MAX16070.1 transporter [Sphingobium sp.]TAJ33886.1 MAG: TolC family protein [Bosea sp. (in: a-proteobacteria)]HCW62600.1 transporter [Sphingobium sp.]
MDRHRFRHSVAILLAVAVTGCARYTPLPLSTAAPLAPSLGALDASTPQAPLTVAQVITLALANNPDLKAARLQRGIAAGQTEQAGLLANPSLSAAFLPLLSGAGTVPAWNLGLAQDIKSILTYKSRQRAARASERQVDASVVWQEWQVAGQARQIATDLIIGARNRQNYLAAYQLLAERSAKLDKALASQTVTLVTVAPDRVALQSARSALDALDQQQLNLRHQLNALLGLSPEVVVPLAAEPDLPPFDPAQVRGEIATLPDRRPDLLALRMGYAASDEQLRQAIQSQFPDLILGGSVASDNAKVINGGPNLQIGLPIFDQGQAAVATARATRAQLHADYDARLSAAIGTIGSLLREYEQLSAQLEVARRDLPNARAAAARAQAAFGASNLDERGYVDLVLNRFTKEQEIMTLELALLDRQIAIQTLVGAGLPTVDLESTTTVDAR